MSNCPNCGSQLVSELAVEHELDEAGNPTVVKPAAGILICSGCHMAVESASLAAPAVPAASPSPSPASSPEDGSKPSSGDADE